MLKKIFVVVILILSFCNTTFAEKILFIPHDDRPISYQQTIEVVQQSGFEIIFPPAELLDDSAYNGHPDELWSWLFENAPEAQSAVIASDSLLYGGLIPSRKHEISQEVLNARLENFSTLDKLNPNLHIYIFDSLLRTPHNGTKGDIEEPEYYATYGADIFQYTKFLDKQETQGLNFFERMEMNAHRAKIPDAIFEDWLNRREKNIAATKKLLELTASGTVDYLILGRDDNSPLSQTHREYREILNFAAGKNLSKEKFQCMPGIDEFNLLLLTRAVNDLTGAVPRVKVKFNAGKGGETVPAFSDEKISASIDAAIIIAGAKKVSDDSDADFILLVNTDLHGQTLWGHNPVPNGSDFAPDLIATDSTKNFAELVEKHVKKNLPVGVADINFANGADNALMKILQEKNLLFKLQSYSGWNTATNSTGFALATGILAKKMSAESKQKLLLRRYLDDWGYQANVRTIVGNEIVKNFGDASLYYNLLDKKTWAENLNTKLLREWSEKNLPVQKKFTVKNTWDRMFECEIDFEE